MDYIEKDEALAIIENRQRELCPMGRYSRNAVYGSDRESFDNWQEILDEIEALPSVDVAPVRHGRWECGKPCPVCGRDRFEGLDADIWADWEPSYCPHCGAKMDLEG